jgi:hypothetical protein
MPEPRRERIFFSSDSFFQFYVPPKTFPSTTWGMRTPGWRPLLYTLHGECEVHIWFRWFLLFVFNDVRCFREPQVDDRCFIQQMTDCASPFVLRWGKGDTYSVGFSNWGQLFLRDPTEQESSSPRLKTEADPVSETLSRWEGGIIPSMQLTIVGYFCYLILFQLLHVLVVRPSSCRNILPRICCQLSKS